MYRRNSNAKALVAYSFWAATMMMDPSFAFVPSHRPASVSSKRLQAAPQRLAENAEGVVYVNDKCINCAACSNFAPSVFRRADQDYTHIVHHQPESAEEILDARAAMAACPVAAIRSETLAQRRHRMSGDTKEAVTESWTSQDEALVKQMALSPKVNGLDLPFPRPLLYHDATTTDTSATTPNNHNLLHIYNVGHHNEKSFGATPYLVQAKVDGKSVWIMVDTPRFGKSAVDAVTQITGSNGPDYLFLTHVDDTEGHEKWTAEFPPLKRIFHLGDSGRHNWRGDRALETDVEILLTPPHGESPPPANDEGSPFYAYAMDGTTLGKDWQQQFMEDDQNDVVILHTPGHSPGSITLFKKSDGKHPGVIFTGDHYSYTTRTGRMSGFPRYGNNLHVQAKSLENLLQLDWDVVAPGHGHPRDYSQEPNKIELKRKEMEEAIADLHK